MENKLKFVQTFPPCIMFDIFHSLIRPILTYENDAWGLSRTGLDCLDEVFLNHVRYIFHQSHDM